MAIAAVTACLRNLLAASFLGDSDLADAKVTAQPLDKARDNAATANQLNVFLYLILPNAALRNQDIVSRSSGDIAMPPLALNLFYLISAYGRDNDVQSPFSHLLLGQAMSVLHDHPLLGKQELQQALAGNDLGSQVERVRITLHPLSIEEISKVWAGFQMQYRLSVAYDVSVVLIDSARAARSGPPILSRGPAGLGYPTQPDAVPPLPAIVRTLPSRPVAIGETWRALGVNLGGDSVVVRITSALLADAVDVPAQVAAADGSVSMTLPGDRNLPAGLCIARIVATTGGTPMASNPVQLAIAPQVTTALPLKVKLSKGAVTVKLACTPPVLPAQRASLVLGSRDILADPHPSKTGTLTFSDDQVQAGQYLARLRVDGVEASVVVDPDAAVPVFDPAKAIQVTA